ncbi:MAG: 4-hydroxy-3-methylbut-2-enyl diphosphate reductase [Clostridia bacterium]|nr:4-hydroxy-3-methylbut-2-enyl diphosphate reductase [Clostridia bacterium]
MEIIIGKNAGFCYGVKRAVDGAKEELKNESGDTYCLGEIVHNKDVVKELENQGMKFIEDISEAKGTTIIRAHGIEKNVYKTAENRGITIKDYTCPKVIKIHEIAEKYAEKGFYIMLTGSKKHPENVGTISFCGDNYFIIENEDMLEDAVENFNNSGIKKLLLISQTTFSVEKFNKIQNFIKENISQDVELIIKNTICAATKVRQQEIEEIAKQVDKMIIIGGKNSSNTKKLFEIANKFCEKSICIENDKELDLNNFDKNDKVGIMAGASTPQESIDRVAENLKNVI